MRVAHETVSKLDSFLTRLRGAGASLEELDDFRAIWNEPDGWLIPREQLVNLSDADLRTLVVYHRGEHYRHTHDETEEADDQRRAKYSAALTEWASADQPLRVDEITQWVGSDPVRARVALDFELSRPEADRRVTAVRFLSPLADPEPAPEFEPVPEVDEQPNGPADVSSVPAPAPARPIDETKGIVL